MGKRNRAEYNHHGAMLFGRAVKIQAQSVAPSKAVFFAKPMAPIEDQIAARHHGLAQTQARQEATMLETDLPTSERPRVWLKLGDYAHYFQTQIFSDDDRPFLDHLKMAFKLRGGYKSKYEYWMLQLSEDKSLAEEQLTHSQNWIPRARPNPPYIDLVARVFYNPRVFIKMLGKHRAFFIKLIATCEEKIKSNRPSTERIMRR